MTRGYFITGTGTEVGKTVFTAGLTCWLRKNGSDAVPMKPVQTGAGKNSQGLTAPDLDFCLRMARLDPPEHERALMQPYCYEPACSPHLAGRLAGGNYPEIHVIEEKFSKLLSIHDSVLVEGAGGVMVPISNAHTMLDIIKALSIPVILVSLSGLGTINHTLLSIGSLKTRGVVVAGFVLNDANRTSEENGFIRKDNPGIIADFGKTHYIGTLRHVQEMTAETLLDAFTSDLADGLQPIFGD